MLSALYLFFLNSVELLLWYAAIPKMRITIKRVAMLQKCNESISVDQTSWPKQAPRVPSKEYWAWHFSERNSSSQMVESRPSSVRMVGGVHHVRVSTPIAFGVI